MMTREKFWEKAHAILDDRKDPLTDPALQRLLKDHPEELEKLVDLCVGLKRLTRALPAPPRRSRWVRTCAAAAGIAALCILFLFGTLLIPPTSTQIEPPSCMVLDMKIRIDEQGLLEESTLTFDGQGWTLVCEEFVESAAAPVVVFSEKTRIPVLEKIPFIP